MIGLRISFIIGILSLNTLLPGAGGEIEIILEKYRNFINPKHKLVESLLIESEVEAYGMKGVTKSYYLFPDKYRIESKIGMLSKLEIFDGEQLISVDRNGYLEFKKSPKDIHNSRLQLLLAGLAFLGDFEDELRIEKLAETEQIVKLRFSYLSSDVQDYIFDKESGQLKEVLSTAMGYEISEKKYNYKDFSGLLFADSLLISMGLEGFDVKSRTRNVSHNLELDDSLFDFADYLKNDYKFRTKSEQTSLAFKLQNNHIYLPARINNLPQKYNFIFDTGAQASAISSELAGELDLDLNGKVLGIGATGVDNFAFTEIKQFSIGNLDVFKQSVAVIDFGDIKKNLGVDLDGLIGYDFISRIISKIDYRKQQITFSKKLKLSKKYKTLKLNLEPYSNLFVVKFSIRNQEGFFIIDTGSNSFFDISKNFAQKLEFDSLDRMEEVTISGIGAKKQKTKVVEDFEFDFFDKKVRTNFLIHEPGEGVFKDSTISGIIGSGFLKDYKIILDYRNKCLYLEDY